jgi:hypothetical protein
MKPADVASRAGRGDLGACLCRGRIALNEFSPELMTTPLSIAALPCLFVARPKVSWWCWPRSASRCSSASFLQALPSPTAFRRPPA